MAGGLLLVVFTAIFKTENYIKIYKFMSKISKLYFPSINYNKNIFDLNIKNKLTF